MDLPPGCLYFSPHVWDLQRKWHLQEMSLENEGREAAPQGLLRNAIDRYRLSDLKLSAWLMLRSTSEHSMGMLRQCKARSSICAEMTLCYRHLLICISGFIKDRHIYRYRKEGV